MARMIVGIGDIPVGFTVTDEVEVHWTSFFVVMSMKSKGIILPSR